MSAVDMCKVERAEKRRKLFPITLTDYATLKKWECLDSDTGEALAEAVRKYHLPDFSNWQHPAAFARAVACHPEASFLSVDGQKEPFIA
jgi:hypothetical protein